jgi:hypothetical protein
VPRVIAALEGASGEPELADLMRDHATTAKA